jgi:cytochrome c556
MLIMQTPSQDNDAFWQDCALFKEQQQSRELHAFWVEEALFAHPKQQAAVGLRQFVLGGAACCCCCWAFRDRQ